MDQALRLNRMPSPTWNRLKLNEACESAFSAENDPKEESRIPSEVSFEEKDRTSFKEQRTGAGEEVEKMENLGRAPIIITSPIVRMYFKKLTEDYYKDLIVVSYNEVDSNVELQSVGMVTI